MHFQKATEILNSLLLEKDPPSFDRGWIRVHAPRIYRFVQKKIRNPVGGIDWDRITSSLDRKLQRRWILGQKKPRKRAQYEDSNEVEILLQKYQDKLYVFLAPADQADKSLRDFISIAFVRIAQKGNMLATHEITKLLRYTVDEWLDHSPRVSRLKGYDSFLDEQIAGCIRRYRYTGSFMAYLFITLEYAGRSMRSFSAYSLDEVLADGDKRRVENVVQDAETNQIQMYEQGI